jgi:hypothetical protein
LTQWLKQCYNARINHDKGLDRPKKTKGQRKMNKIKYITRDREAGNVIDEFATREEAEAAIRAYEEEDRANGCYEEDFYEVTAPVFSTDGGDHILVAFIADGGDADARTELYVGRDNDGNHNLIASDNASMWVVGDEDDAERNQEHWKLITERVGAIDFDAIRDIDEDLADWLAARRGESWDGESYEIWLVPNGRTGDFMRGMTGRGYPDACQCWGSFDSIDDVKARLRELADENFRRDEGEYDRIWGECAAARPEEADQGFSEPEIACDKYCQECADAFGFEWNDDLKYVRVRKVRNLRNGDVDFVEVL